MTYKTARLSLVAIGLAGIFGISAVPTADAFLVCRYNPVPPDVLCLNTEFLIEEKLNREQRIFDTRSRDPFTFEPVRKVEQPIDSLFPGGIRYRAWNRGLTTSLQDRTRFNRLKESSPQ